MNDADPTTFWDDLYSSRPVPTQPRPNARLPELVDGLSTGAALDLGCGNGGDALWLAGLGWRVTAVDISATAAARVRDLASELGLGDRVTTAACDLERSFPDGRFDLVNIHYLHTPFDLDKTNILRASAESLRPGGHLLVVDHGSTAPWSWEQSPDVHYPHPQEVFEQMHLESASWTAVQAEALQRTASGPDGQTAEVTDHVLVVRRSA